MPEVMVTCPSCGRTVLGRNLRSTLIGNKALPVCKRCFYKFKGQDLADRKAKSKLTDKVTYSQTELPF